MRQDDVEDSNLEKVKSDSRDNLVFFITGPTCSGKSSLASLIAQKHNGVVINADSMQVYRDLPILTARPRASEEKHVPHRLYGVLDGSQKGNVAWWVGEVHKVISKIYQQGKMPILCGGTGMYFNALVHGLSHMPVISEEVRSEARKLVAHYGSHQVHSWLEEEDPWTAQKLYPSDTQRVTRAWEVLKGSGRGLVWWQKQPGIRKATYYLCGVHLEPQRDWLKEAIKKRFYKMLSAGALDEVKFFAQRHLDPSLPIMRAHGVRELLAYLRGEMSYAYACEKSITETRRYAKRQRTWFAHHVITEPQNRKVIKQPFCGDVQIFSEIENSFPLFF